MTAYKIAAAPPPPPIHYSIASPTIIKTSPIISDYGFHHHHHHQNALPIIKSAPIFTTTYSAPLPQPQLLPLPIVHSDIPHFHSHDDAHHHQHHHHDFKAFIDHGHIDLHHDPHNHLHHDDGHHHNIHHETGGYPTVIDAALLKTTNDYLPATYPYIQQQQPLSQW